MLGALVGRWVSILDFLGMILGVRGGVETANTQ
jgi:hypothetical protein